MRMLVLGCVNAVQAVYVILVHLDVLMFIEGGWVGEEVVFFKRVGGCCGGGPL